MEATESITDVIVWGVSLFLIAMGALCRKYPDFIAGYITMSPEKKKYVDAKGLGKHMCNGMGWTAVACLVCFYLLRLVEMDDETRLLISYVGVLIVGIIIVSITAQKYDYNR